MELPRMTRATLAASVGIAFLAAILALVGWTFDVRALTTIVPGGTSMKRLTVAALLLLAFAGGAALGGGRALRVAGGLAAGTSATIGALVLFEWTAGVDLGIDLLLGPDDGASVPAGRPAPNTALALLALGVAEILLLARRRAATRIATGSAVVALALAFIGVIGYTTGVADYLQIGSFTAMAAPTGIALLALSVGTLVRGGQSSGWVLLREDTPQARLARAMVLGVAFLPIGLGILRMALEIGGVRRVNTAWIVDLTVIVVLLSVVGLTVRGLQRAAEQERSVLDGVRGQAIYLLDTEGRVERWNPGAQEITGYTFDEVRGRTLEFLFPPGEGHRAREEVELAAKGGQHASEGWRVRKDGSRYWVSATITAIRETDGTIRGYAKIARDRTAERTAEEALAAAKERYDLAFDASNDGIWDWDLVTNKVAFSPRWKGMLGHAPDEVADDFESWRSRVHPEDLDGAKKRIEDYLAGRVPRYELEHRMRHKDGTYRWILSRGIVVRRADGTPYRFVGSHTDVTVRKNMEMDVRALNASLTEKARTLDAILRASVDHIFIQDRDGRFLYASEGGARLFGLTAGAMTGRTPAELAIAGEPFESQVDDVLITGRMRAFEATWSSPGGARSFESAVVPMRDKEGRIVGILTHSHDVTERRRAHEEIAAMNATLEQRVAERTADLEAANKELEAFAYSVSHDLRAPLRAIDGFSRVIVEDYDDKLDDEGRDALARVRAASQRMGSLIDDILRLSRVSRAELKREPIDVSAIAEELTTELRRQQPMRDVTTVIEPGLTVVGDPALLRAVLQNFLDNAWKFTSKHTSAHIEIGSKDTPEGRAIYVRDDGAGFDPRYADKLFGAFQRLHQPSEFPGNGIGLATVKRIIQRHGGHVWAEGDVEKGATFQFTIPDRVDDTWQERSHPSSSSKTTQTTRSSA